MVLRKRVFRLLACLVVLALAFIVKGSYLREKRDLPDFSRPTLDAKYHDDWAWGLTSGDWTPRMDEARGDAYFRAPLYPYFLSLLYRIFGHSYLAVRLAQILIGSLSALIFFLLTRLLFGTAPAN